MKSFNFRDYDHYLWAQTTRWSSKKNKRRKLENYRRHIKFLLDSGAKIDSVLCQGVRNDNEIRCFKALLNPSIIKGTDIAFEDLDAGIIKCDFIKLPQSLDGPWDLIYSNSLDHAMNPCAALKEWSRVLSDDGWMVISFSCEDVSDGDPTSFDRDEAVRFMNDIGMTVLNIIDEPLARIVVARRRVVDVQPVVTVSNVGDEF